MLERNYEKIAIEKMEERIKKRERKKRQRMPVHSATLKNIKLQQERFIKKISRISKKKKN